MEGDSISSLFFHNYSFADLPMEILLKIFQYLHFTDRIQAGTTCRRWFEATQHSDFIKKQKSVFSKIHFADSTTPISDFLKSFQNIQTVEVHQVDFGDSTKFWNLFDESIEGVEIRDSDIRGKQFIEIVKSLKHLKKLVVRNCRELFMAGNILESTEDQKILQKTFKTISHLGLTYNRYLSDAIFNRFTSIMPNLTELNLSGCHISFHKGLYKKFYPIQCKDASENILTFHFVYQFIKFQSKHLKKLNFSETLIDGKALDAMAEIKELNLETLILTACDQLTNPGIINFVSGQSNIRHLDLSLSVRLTDQSLSIICIVLSKLKTLKIRRCRAITDLGIKDINRLSQLQILDVSECECITSKGIIEGVAKDENVILKELHLSALNICEKAVLQVANNLKNLILLDLSFCMNAITDHAIQMIFKNLILLRELNLNYCHKLSDAAMLGLNNESDSLFEKNTTEVVTTKLSVEHQTQIEPRHINHTLDIAETGNAPLRISLRSREEQEIVKDAQIKKNMQKLCERNSAISGNSAYSISNLKGLRVLKLAACNKITDVSLQYCFHFHELSTINLAKCQQISVIGIQALVKNCPSLENLDLSECQNINDQAIKTITVHVKRLKELYLERCSNITDFSLDYIVLNCNMLKVLDVRRCRALCSEPNLRLTSLTTLKHLYMSESQMHFPTNETLKPKPPPFPF